MWGLGFVEAVSTKLNRVVLSKEWGNGLLGLL